MITNKSFRLHLSNKQLQQKEFETTQITNLLAESTLVSKKAGL